MNMFLYNSNEINKNYNFYIKFVSTIYEPKNNSIIFLKDNDTNLLEKLTNVKECILIINEKLNGKLLEKYNLVIYDKFPRVKYSELLRKILLEDEKNRKYEFKDGIYYGENVSIGTNVLIEPFVKIGHNVKIGNNSIIKAGSKIGNNCCIGKNCYIGENSVIGGEGIGVEKGIRGINSNTPHIGGVIIKENVEIGPLSNIVSGRIEPTIIEKNTKIGGSVYISHDDHIKENVVIISGAMICGAVTIGENSYIGPNCTIADGKKIGMSSKVTMGAIVVSKVRDNETVTGNFAVPHKNFLEIMKFLLLKSEE